MTTYKDDRPSQVVFVVVTDGQENASREFRKDVIEKMVKQKTEEDNWQFVFLSADLDAIGDAMSLGFAMDSSLLFDKSARGSAEAWRSLSKSASNYRSRQRRNVGFVPSDRKHPEDPGKKESG